MYLKVRTLKSVAKRVIHITSFRCSFRRVNFNGLDLDINIPFVPDFSVWGPLIYHQYHHLGKRSQVLEFDTIPFSKSTKELFVKMSHCWLTSCIFWGITDIKDIFSIWISKQKWLTKHSKCMVRQSFKCCSEVWVKTYLYSLSGP